MDDTLAASLPAATDQFSYSISLHRAGTAATHLVKSLQNTMSNIRFEDGPKKFVHAQQLIEQERSKPDSLLKTTGLDNETNIEGRDLPVYVVCDDKKVPSDMTMPTRNINPTGQLVHVRPQLVHIFAGITDRGLNNSFTVTIKNSTVAPSTVPPSTVPPSTVLDSTATLFRLPASALPKQTPSLITLIDPDHSPEYLHIMSSLVTEIDDGEKLYSKDNALGRVDTYLIWSRSMDSA